ncbi:MAG: hypothetical protein LBF79_01615, partial [Dysgonamonadaceae bacterium]|nr:hypothetical protein [Dysgonamonadaceae bacterium]
NIDNPLIHMGLEPASVFLEKTYSSVLNLHRIERILQNKSGQKIYSKLTRSEFFLRKFRLSGIVAIFFRLFRRLIERHLLGERPSLRVFDLYRLCLLCTFRDG